MANHTQGPGSGGHLPMKPCWQCKVEFSPASEFQRICNPCHRKLDGIGKGGRAINRRYRKTPTRKQS